jgi:hypothetical protein
MLYLAMADLSGWYSLMCQCCSFIGMLGLTNVDLTTFAGDPIDISNFQAKITDRPKESGNLPRQEAYIFYILSCWQPADAVKDRSNKV